MNPENNKKAFFKVLKKKKRISALSSIPSENDHQWWMQNEDFFRQTKAERIYYQKGHTGWNPKGFFFFRLKKNNSYRSFELHERIKDYRNDKDGSKYERTLAV